MDTEIFTRRTQADVSDVASSAGDSTRYETCERHGGRGGDAGHGHQNENLPLFLHELPDVSNQSRAADDVNKLFGTYDEEFFVPIDQQLVSRLAMELKMVGAIQAQPYPSPIGLEQALLTKLGEAYIKWRKDGNLFPAAIMDQAWTGTLPRVRAEVERRNLTRGEGAAHIKPARDGQ